MKRVEREEREGVIGKGMPREGRAGHLGVKIELRLRSVTRSGVKKTPQIHQKKPTVADIDEVEAALSSL